MAKKKKKQTKRKSTSKKSTKPEKKDDSASTFWPITGAIVLLLLAFLLLLGSFSAGGPLPEQMFTGVFQLLGNAAYFVPVALACLGVWKFKAEGHKVPLQEFVSIVVFLWAFAGWLFITFSTTEALTSGANGGGG